MPDRVGRLGAVLAIVVAVGLSWPASSALAHPLGNFSISQYTQILVTSDIIELHYIVDLAEIPTSQEIQEARIVPDADAPSVQAYLSRKVEALKAGLLLEVDGRRLPLQTTSSDVIFPPGAAGLPTMKLGLVYRATVPASSSPDPSRLRYLDANFAGRVGWKEVVAVPAWGVTFASSSVPSKDKSQALTDYPVDLLNRPPQVLEAQVVFARKAVAPVTGGAEARPGIRQPGSVPRTGITASPTTAASALGTTRLAPNRQGTPRNAFTDLMTVEDLSLRIVLIGLIVAAALGAFHALEPGHGKTIVAAYLIGSRGTAWHATWLGLIVTASHTAGVYLLGVVTLYASRYVVPERLYPWLGVVSGLTIAAVGGVLFLRRCAGGIADHEHSHAHDRGHAHVHHHGHGHGDEPGHDHGHERHASHAHGHNVHPSDETEHDHHAHGERPGAVSFPALVALGITGGIVPCPAALVVLLSALSLHRVGFGLLLIVAFSVGLAAVLIAIGMLMVFARRFMGRFQSNGPLTTRWLPLASAVVITLLGLGITVRAILAAGIPGIKPG